MDLQSNDKNNLIKVFDENLKIHQLLFKDDKVIPKLTSLITVTDKTLFKNQDLISRIILLEQNLKSIDSKNRESFITGYSHFSKELTGVIKQFGLKDKYTHFYCPMVDKTWVSTGYKIENPYAPDMRDCGEIIQE